MPEQLISIQVPFLAVFAQRMATMRLIIRIAFTPMRCQLLPCIRSPLEREYLESGTGHDQANE